MERQAHGFSYQAEKIKQYNLSTIDPATGEELLYTDKWDAFYNNIPVQIKDKKIGGNIELADIFRQSETTEDFILIVGFWEKEKTNIIEEHILYINGNEWHSYFDPICLDKYQTLLKTITNDHSDDAKWTQAINQLRKEWSQATPYLIVPRPKRDHKNQKRIQCAINKVVFYKHFLPKYEVGDFFERNNKIIGTKK